MGGADAGDADDVLPGPARPSCSWWHDTKLFGPGSWPNGECPGRWGDSFRRLGGPPIPIDGFNRSGRPAGRSCRRNPGPVHSHGPDTVTITRADEGVPR